MATLLHGLLDRTAARLPDKTALVCGSQRITYAHLRQRSIGLATQLQADGVTEGDRVGVLLDNGPDLVVGLYAVLRLGAICVPLNPQIRADKLGGILLRTQASALLVQDSLLKAWRAARQQHALYCRVFVSEGSAPLEVQERRCRRATDAGIAQPSWPLPDSDAPAFISHTSGTTGIPKGVTLSHRNLAVITATICDYLQLGEEDVVLSALPLSFNYGLTQLLTACAVGATLVLERNFAFPVKILEAMARERATIFPAVPTMYEMLLPLQAFHGRALPSLRMMTSASAALPTARIDELRQRFPHVRLYVMYGQTECTRISFLPPELLDARRGSIGRGLPGQDCWLADEAGARLPDGSVGELMVQGEHVMHGYWDDPVATAAKLTPGTGDGAVTMRTGDLFRSDDDGWLYFIERMDDVIKTRGEKVSPREVEQAIARIPGVVECIVVGIPDPLLGEAVKAYVVVASGIELGERDVIRHCLAALETYMAPKQVAFVDALPRTYTGKIRKHDLP